jgi:GTP-binding protein
MSPKTGKRLVALVGRPNVGKSTLFNMLVGFRKALVEDTPGLTRDRHYAQVAVRDKSFILVDTGGFEPSTDDVMLSQMRAQTMLAVEQADIIVFMADGKTGVTPSDTEIVRTLQQTQKTVFYAVNKIDSEKREDLALDFHSLGVDEIYPISAMTGYGLDDLLDALLKYIPEGTVSEDESETVRIPRIAVVGRPNCGKSTLINLLLGEERMVANPEPGTTRDSIDTLVRRDGKDYLFIDTAGIRRRSRVVDRVEKYSVIKAFQSVDRAHITLLMMDSNEPVTEQDARIAGYAYEKGRGIILLLNKWDLIPKDSKTHEKYIELARRGLKYLDHAPILTISALQGKRVPKIFHIIDDIYEKYRKRVSTALLNRFLERVVSEHPPGMHRSSKRIKIYYLTQVRTAPPTFAFFCNYPESVHFSYKRYLENQLRETFDFNGAPLKLLFRKRKGKPDYIGAGHGKTRRG